MGEIIVQALGVGLAFALLPPYLLEWAFPRRRSSAVRKGAWPAVVDEVDFTAELENPLLAQETHRDALAGLTSLPGFEHSGHV